jgi:threonine dehydrogenase-like Zn-dependent dehydrogenase
METAVSLIMDGSPQIGEKVAVLGQGVVGLLVTALLARHPLEYMVSLDEILLRREFSLRIGAQESLAPDQIPDVFGADLVYELSGNPEGLNLALDLVGDHGRIVVGSWYGTRQTPINLGEKFHRGRVKIISSQVSQIDPSLRGRWDKARRFEQAWKRLQEIKPSQLVTHRFEFGKAPEAYKLLTEHPESALGMIFQY